MRSSAVAKPKVIALTFDDGPSPGQTQAVLRILKKYEVVATFFEIGEEARAHPELSRMTASAGMLVGNHSETHPNLKHLSAKAVASQVERAQKDITKASGKRPTYFRPPGGNVPKSLYPVLAKNHLKWVQWDIDTNDWKRPPASQIVSRVMRQAKPGAVVLMHEGGGDRSHTIKALPTIIKKLRAEGYQFVTLDALKRLPHTMG